MSFKLFFVLRSHLHIRVLIFFSCPHTYVQLQAHVQVDACVSERETCSLNYIELWVSLLADFDGIYALVFRTSCRQLHTRMI